MHIDSGDGLLPALCAPRDLDHVRGSWDTGWVGSQKKTPRSPRSPKIIPQPEMDPLTRVEGWGGVEGGKSEEGGNPTRIAGDQPGLAYLARGGCPIWARQGLVQY